VAIGVYFVVSFSLSWVRAAELQTTTWDLGIYQQALWSTAHGRAFYEAADLETGGYNSLLQVHTVFVLYAAVPLYAALPYEGTLFAVQSAVVAGAAIPLYLLGRDVTHSPRLALAGAAAYLVWTPVLASNLYDFHAEAFLPLELFAIVLFWERGRYWTGAAVVALAFATIEIAPVLLFFVGVFFLLPSSQTWNRVWASARQRAPWATWALEFRRAVASPRVRAAAALVLASVGAYYLLVYLRVDVLTAALGTTPLPTAPTGYVIGGTPAALGLSLQNLGVGVATKLGYWTLILALLGFVPLFAPRALLLCVPWFGFTMLSSNLNYVGLGFQYGFIAASSVLVAFVYGIPRAAALLRSWNEAPADPTPVRSPATVRLGPGRSPRRRLLLALFIVLVAGNFLLSPYDPLVQNQGLGSAFRLSYSPVAGVDDVGHVAGLIPTGATVIASDNLFPLIANDANAYSFFWTRSDFLGLPFNLTHLPQYVLLSTDRAAAVSPWLATALYVRSDFGVRAVAWTSPVGPVLLFQHGYSGKALELGDSPVVPFTVAGPSVADLEAGYATTVPGSAGTPCAASDPGAIGPFFSGPGASLPAGNLSIRLWVHATSLTDGAPPPAAESALSIAVTAFGQVWYVGDSVSFGALSAPGWAVETLNITVPEPTILFDVQGDVQATDAQVFLESLVVTPL